MGRPKNFTRDAVLEKALPVFWRRGFADASLHELEQATWVNKSGLYAEFKDKEDLFVQSLRCYELRKANESIQQYQNIAQDYKTQWDTFGGMGRHQLERPLLHVFREEKLDAGHAHHDAGLQIELIYAQSRVWHQSFYRCKK